MDILALSLILAGKFLLRSLKYKVGFLFFVDVLSPVKEVPLYSYFGVFLVMNRCSVQFSRSVVYDSLQPHESKHARPPCPSPTPGVHSDSCPSSQ